MYHLLLAESIIFSLTFKLAHIPGFFKKPMFLIHFHLVIIKVFNKSESIYKMTPKAFK